MSLYQFENAVVWMNGTSLLGHVEELELPELEWEMKEHESIGLRGVSEYPKRVNALESTLTWADYSPELAQAAADPWTGVELQVRSNFGRYDGISKTADVLQIITLGARFKSNSLGTLSSDEFERESMLTVDYVKEAWDDRILFEYGVNPPIYRTGATGSNLGTDLFAQLRSNLGI